MKQRLSMITLGVSDIAAARSFYEALGFEAEPFDSDSVVFFDMNGVILGLFGHQALAQDANVKGAPLKNPAEQAFRGVSVSMNLETKDDVDRALADAEAAGAEIAKPAEDVFWGGYSGYFKDPDGHLWEVAYNPFWTFDAKGQVVLPSKQKNDVP